MSARRARAGGLAAAILLVYLGALAQWRDAVPPGLNNDAAEEVLRGLELLEAGRLQVMSSSPGIPQETLYLYGIAALTRVLGATTVAIQLLSWATALACLVMVGLAARRVEPRLPMWVPLLLAASSLWLFHYARAGVRAISAPFFALAVGLLLDRAERAGGRGPALACGAVLGLSLYAYTACRVLVAVVLVYAAIRLLRARGPRAPLWRRYGLILAAALAVSIPNLLFAAAAPRDFLLRGGYVVRGDWRTVFGHLAASAALPLHYVDRYRTLATEAHIFDGISAGLTAAGLDPVSVPLALFVVIGLLPAWRRRREPIVLYMVLLWVLSVLLLGFAGPSLTRLLIALPALLIVGSLGAGSLLAGGTRNTVVVALLLATAVAASAYGYFVTFATSPAARAYFSAAATPIGERAHALAANGRRVLCVVGKDANVVRYLTHGDGAAVDVVEFYRRSFDPRDLSPVFRPDVVLVERRPELAAAGRANTRSIVSHATFDEIVPGP